MARTIFRFVVVSAKMNNSLLSILSVSSRTKNTKGCLIFGAAIGVFINHRAGFGLSVSS